jgi:hypothetical protein
MPRASSPNPDGTLALSQYSRTLSAEDIALAAIAADQAALDYPGSGDTATLAAGAGDEGDGSENGLAQIKA